MKLKLTTVLLNLNDSPVVDDDKVVVLAKQALINAILSEMDGDRNPVRGEDKIKRYDIYRKLKHADNETDFEVEDVATLRKAVLIFSPLIAGQLRDILNGA